VLLELAILAGCIFCTDLAAVFYTLAVSKNWKVSAIVLAGSLEFAKKVDILLTTDIRGHWPVIVSVAASMLGCALGLYLGGRYARRAKR